MIRHYQQHGNSNRQGKLIVATHQTQRSKSTLSSMGQNELLFARTVDERRPPHAGGDREDPRLEFPNDGCLLIESTNEH